MGIVETVLLSFIFFSPLSPFLWETARYTLKYRLKGPLNPKQPTNQLGNKLVIQLGLHVSYSGEELNKHSCFRSDPIFCFMLVSCSPCTVYATIKYV